jgi:tRNA A37 threonylcarbamoyladenosine biosynthesis protein TsaE
MMDISRYLDFPEGIVMIEWPSRLGVLMPEKVVRVSIEVVSLEGGRRVCFQ